MQLKSSDNILDLNNEKIVKQIFIFKNSAHSVKKYNIKCININKKKLAFEKGKT